LPYLNEGNNKIPTIHLKDLARFVVKVAENPPEGSPYLLAFDETEVKTQKAIIQSISSGVGSAKI
jgi:adenylate kinase